MLGHVAEEGALNAGPVLPKHDKWFVEPVDAAAVSDAEMRESIPILQARGVPGLSLRGARRLTRLTFESIRALDRLRCLDVSGTAFANWDAAKLGSMADLRAIYLDNTRITDAGLEVLAALPRVEVVSVNGTLVTDEGATTLCARSLCEKFMRTRRSSQTEGVSCGSCRFFRPSRCQERAFQMAAWCSSPPASVRSRTFISTGPR